MKPVVPPAHVLALEVMPARLAPSLAALHRATQHARERSLDRQPADFDRFQLDALGVCTPALRELLQLGWLRPNPGSSDPPCFVLTEAALLLTADWPCVPAGNVAVLLQPLDAGEGQRTWPIPKWNPDLRELWWHGWLIKKLKRLAPSQETILAALEELGWLMRIDDPLPGVLDMDRKQRLHDAVVGLNARQTHRFLLFERDGSGEGIRWSVREEAQRLLFPG